MNALLILGAGGHGKVVADTALLLGWKTVAFLDDRAAELKSCLGFPVVGTLRDLSSQGGAFTGAVVAVGDARLRLELGAACQRAGLALVSLVHPDASVSRFATIGAGSVVFAQAAINAGAVIGAACIVNTGATVDHDCVLENGVHVCPGANLAGDVRVGSRSWIGIAAAVRQGITIGSDATVGAGAVVVGDVPGDTTVVGVPARQRINSI